MSTARSLTSLICLFCVAYAQTETATQIREARIRSGYSTMRDQATQYLRLKGTAVSGTKTDDVIVNAYYKFTAGTAATDAPQLEQLDLEVLRNGSTTPSLRLIGDGALFHSYDYTTKRYWVASYTHWDATTKTYPISHADFVQAMGLGASSEAAYVARLIRDVYGDPSTVIYSTWLPGVDPTDGATDPNDVVYTLGTPKRREFTFDVDVDQTTNVTTLKAIIFYDLRKIGGLDRETNWTLEVMDPLNVPTELNFTPLTVAELVGWRQVVRPIPVLK